MLSEKEKNGIREILKKLSERDIKSLAGTVTNHMLYLESNDEAYNAILAYANTAIDVLRRQKVKKEYIFQYLHQCGCNNISPQSDKMGIVRAALHFWGSTNVQALEYETMEDDTMVCEDLPQLAAVSSPALQQTITLQNTEPLSSVVSDNNDAGQEVHEMAKQFIRWFYPMLNNGHVANIDAADNFGPHHFWRDCKLKVCTPHYENLVEGNNTVAQKLLALIGQHQLYFNPLDELQGIKCSLEPHGLVLILVGGGLHRGDLCIGLYEQTFGLIRDPATGNNWKIKFTELRLIGKDLDICPLEDNDVQFALEYS